MPVGLTGAVRKELRALYTVGAVGGLTDGHLLERFADRRDEAAFEALVDRHGPMVLRVCRGLLADPHDVEDAFQATFLVLVRRAGSVSKADSVASWLFGVARRVAARARVDAARRRRHERIAAVPESSTPGEGAPPDPGPALHDEVARLPGRYREAVVLCYLEGYTCEEAARRLGRPVGTVKARLSRARGRLRDRLACRGIGPTAGATFGATAAGAPPAVPAGLLRATTEAATRLGGPGAAAAVALTRGVLRSMLLTKMKLAAAVALAIGAAAAGTVVIAQGQPKAGAPSGAASAPPADAGAEDPSRDAIRDALSAADAITDPHAKSRALVRLGKIQAGAGDLAAARDTFRRAHQAAGLVAAEALRRVDLAFVAGARARAGETGPARATFDELTRSARGLDPLGRERLLVVVAVNQDLAGFQVEARESVKAARAALDQAPASPDRDVALYSLAALQARWGDFDGALAAAEILRDRKSPYLAYCLQSIAGYCEGADRATARRVAARVLGLSGACEYQRSGVHQQVAAAMARAGDIPGALATARAIDQAGLGPLDRPTVTIPPALAVIATEQAKAGDRGAAGATLREAIELVRKLPEGDGPAGLFRQVAEAAAAVGDLDLAREAVAAIDNETDKAPALVAIARAQAKSGDKAAALETLREAGTSVGGIRARRFFSNDDPARNKEDALRQIATAQAEAGDVAGALLMADAVGDEGARAELLGEVARIQARAGAAALAWASRLRSPEARASALAGVAEGSAARRAGRHRAVKAGR
jgi:RNA polymerase sigma factor (sigma-70 family)